MDQETVNKQLELLRESFAKNGYDENCVRMLQQLIEAADNYNSIDKQMVEILKEQFADTLMKKAELMEAMKTIENGSVIVYFKSAQLFKIYKKDDIETLLGGQLKTLYKNVGMTYEVIPNNMGQKIIMIGEGSIVDNIDKIKSYVVSFMKNKGVVEFDEKDITCYKDDKNDGNVEIIINNYYVRNSAERDEIIKELLSYITKNEKSNKLAMRLGTDTYSVIEGTTMLATPTGKQIIGKYVDPDRGLVSNTLNCHQIQKNGDAYTIVYNIYNINQTAEIINNGTINNITNVPQPEDEIDECKDSQFVTHIKNNHPEWYKEDEWVEKEVIYNHYVEICGYVSKKVFTSGMKDVIFTEETRKRINKTRVPIIKLVPIITIPDI